MRDSGKVENPECRGRSVGVVHAQIAPKSFPLDGNPLTVAIVHGFNIGGTREAPAKKSRLNQPGAVLVYENTNEKVFSVNTSTRDDRCFVVKKEAILCVLTSACRGHTFVWKSPNESMLPKTSFKLANT